MNYCFNYNRDTEKSKYINEVAEWTIKYNSKDNTLLDFLDLHTNKRINLYIENLDVDIKFLQDLLNKYNNLYLKLSVKYYDIIKQDKKLFSRYFFETEVDNWETFIGLCEWGVSDIYIIGILGFELDKVAEIAAKYKVQSRVYPNISQTIWEESNPLKTFFIRPEDIDKYSKYIDIIEFYDADKQIDTYYEIYCKDKKWIGKLNEIIKGFDSELDNKFIIPRFVDKRIKCGKKCLKGAPCRMCEDIENLAKTLEKADLYVKAGVYEKIDNKREE